MCGIFGIIDQSRKKNTELLKKMSKTQIYRGPDKQYFFYDKKKGVSIGTNRLAIIDVKNGHQPMVSNNKSFFVNFNGTIYNFNEIKNFLKSKKFIFKTECDTEVIANAYQYWGDKAFNYFDGMWAISIYDKKKSLLILSRDYVGQKPLYYSNIDKRFYFSSQINGILVDKRFKRKISTKSIKTYFQYSFIPSPNTILENIYQVNPGQIVKYDIKKDKLISKTFWDITKGADYNFFFKKNSTKNLKKIFRKNSDNHQISDLKLSILLSSGIDSFLVAKYMNSKKNVNSYTLGMHQKSFDEAALVKKIKGGFKKKIYYLTQNTNFKNLKILKKNLNSPIGDSSLLPTYSIFNKIGKSRRISLGGDGGDELFLGYITFDAYYIANIIKKFLPNPFLKFLSFVTKILPVNYKYMNYSMKIRKFFENLPLSKSKIIPSWMNSLDYKELNILFKNKLKKNELYKKSDYIFNKTENPIRNAQYYYLKFYLPLILEKVDQSSMFNSVEHRSPFLGKNIINFSLDLSIDKLFKLFKNKNLLKKEFKNVIPKLILNNKKHGFAFPKDEILFKKKEVFKLIDEKLLTNRDFFIKCYEKYLNKKKDYSIYLWNEIILNFCLQNILKN